MLQTNCGLLHLNDDLVNLAGEGGFDRTVPNAEGNGRLIVETDIGGFVGGKDVGLRTADFAFGNLLAVDRKRGRTTFSRAATFIGKVELDGGIAGRQCIGALDDKTLDP